MAGTQSRYEWQFKQRLTSGGLNAQTAALARNTSELARHLTDQDAVGQTGILNGFLVTVVAATLDITIGTGLGHFYDPAAASLDSRAVWLELRAAKTATLDAGDAANPRWDVVEVKPASINGTAEIIDFFNPADNTFSPAVVSVQKISEAAVQVRKGTPAASPQPPSGDPDWIPLAYVYVPANAALLLDGDVLYCRPIVRPMVQEVGPGPYTASEVIGRTQRVHGGGIDVATAGLDATIHAQLSGHFSRSGQRFLMPTGTALRLSANNYDGGLPGASNTTHFYAVPPSAVYPTGYSPFLAEREFIIPTASRIATGGYASGQYHCFVVASSKAPNTTQRGEPAVGSTFEITHPTFGALSIDTNRAVYVGCAYYNFGGLQMIAQVTTGKNVAPARTSGNNITALLPIAADTNVSMTTNIVIDSAYTLPTHVRKVRILGFHRLDVQGDLTVVFKDAMSAHSFLKNGTVYRSNTMADLAYGYDFWVVLNSSQQLTINYADGNGNTATNLIRIIEWEDPVLALR